MNPSVGGSNPIMDPMANGKIELPQAAVSTELTVNGRLWTLTIPPWTTLLDLLRERLS